MPTRLVLPLVLACAALVASALPATASATAIVEPCIQQPYTHCVEANWGGEWDPAFSQVSSLSTKLSIVPANVTDPGGDVALFADVIFPDGWIAAGYAYRAGEPLPRLFWQEQVPGGAPIAMHWLEPTTQKSVHVVLAHTARGWVVKLARSKFLAAGAEPGLTIAFYLFGSASDALGTSTFGSAAQPAMFKRLSYTRADGSTGDGVDTARLMGPDPIRACLWPNIGGPLPHRSMGIYLGVPFTSCSG
jgi:hypothetical protein